MPSIRQWKNMILYGSRIPNDKTPLSFYVDMLERNVPFSFSRFGDGEWQCILGRSGANCDGHEYFPEMAKMLQNAVINPYPYIYGMQNFAIKCMGNIIYAFIKKHNVKINWRHSDVFHYANVAGEFNPMIKTLRNHKVVLIGPKHLRPVNNLVFNYDHFIEIPSTNCFKALDSIEKEIRAYATGKTGVVYAFSASMAANCMIHDLYPELGKDNWMIDFGSVWDIYVGIKSRSVYIENSWEEIIKRNCA